MGITASPGPGYLSTTPCYTTADTLYGVKTAKSLNGSDDWVKLKKDLPAACNKVCLGQQEGKGRARSRKLGCRRSVPLYCTHASVETVKAEAWWLGGWAADVRWVGHQVLNSHLGERMFDIPKNVLAPQLFSLAQAGDWHA